MNLSVVTTQFWSLVLQGLALGLIYSLVSLGYTMVYGVLRLINFANSEVFMLGTFAVLWVEITVLGHPVNAKPLQGFELVYTLVIALVGSMIACALLGVLVEFVAYRRLRSRGASRLESVCPQPETRGWRALGLGRKPGSGAARSRYRSGAGW